MRLFFSWQSDIPENTKILRKVLGRICKKLDIEYTEDTRGEAGSDHVVDVLLRKISNSNIFLADLTLVGKDVRGDSLSNSNVCYELGYAESALGRKNIILVFNEEFGSYNDMPFDLGKRIVTKFATKNRQLPEADLKALETELLRKIATVSTPTNDSAKEALNKSEKSLLYYTLHYGSGHLSKTHEGYRAGNDFPWYQPLHGKYDSMAEGRYSKALNDLTGKGYLTVTSHSMNPLNDPGWVLTEEGEVQARAITEDEIYSLPPKGK